MKKKGNEFGEGRTVLRRPAPGVFIPFFWGCGFVILGAGLWQVTPTIAVGYNVLLPYGFSVVFLLLGLVTIWCSFYQLVLRLIPATTIHIPAHRFHLGSGNVVSLVQPGNSNLSRLRLRLLCVEKKTTWHERASTQHDGQVESYTTTKETILHQQTLVEVTDLRVDKGAEWEKTESFSIPTDAHPSRGGDPTSIEWRLELSGKGLGFLSFLHSFDIQVCP
jgi:hypothetical protein